MRWGNSRRATRRSASSCRRGSRDRQRSRGNAPASPFSTLAEGLCRISTIMASHLFSGQSATADAASAQQTECFVEVREEHENPFSQMEPGRQATGRKFLICVALPSQRVCVGTRFAQQMDRPSNLPQKEDTDQARCGPADRELLRDSRHSSNILWLRLLQRRRWGSAHPHSSTSCCP